jgi:hypothetical protein
MPTAYVFAKGTRWREFAWQPGDKLVKSEIPDELFQQLVADGNVVAREEFEPPREVAPPEEPKKGKGAH